MNTYLSNLSSLSEATVAAVRAPARRKIGVGGENVSLSSSTSKSDGVTCFFTLCFFVFVVDFLATTKSSRESSWLVLLTLDRAGAELNVPTRRKHKKAHDSYR